MANPSEAHPAPTLEAVAARAGVSRATASRVLRRASNVSDKARVAVEAAAQELSYSPNMAARSLVTGRSESVAFYVDESEDRLFSDPFFLGLLRAVHTGIADAGMQLIFSVASGPADHQRFLHYASGGHVDGVLLISLHGQDELPHELEAAGVPTVLGGRPFAEDAGLFYVDADNTGGARMATEYLFGRGRRKVATVTGSLDMGAGQDRLTGYRQGVESQGLQVRDELVGLGGFTIAGGYDAMAALLEAEPAIDAVFAASDLTAIGAMRAIEQSGRSVGDDVAVVGFDDIAEAAVSRPALTTVRQPIGRMGRTMSDVLLRRISGETPPLRTVLPVELVQRTSA